MSGGVGAVMPRYFRPPSYILSTHGWEGIGFQFRITTNLGLTSIAWFANNQAVYVPITVHAPLVLTHAVVGNGSSVSGNLDVGLYDEAFARIVSTGSTAQSGTTTVQTIDITDTLVDPGRYYLALASSTTSATFFQSGAGTAAGWASVGVAEQASALALPSTATPVLYTRTSIPLFGFSRIGAV